MRQILSAIFFCVALALPLASLRADEPTLTKMVVQMVTPGPSGDPVLAKPKTIYRGGDKYSRVEEKPDPKAEEQTLIITDEPDCWIINMIDKTGRHQVDAGPKFVTSAPIFWTTSGQPEPDFVELEFGRELEFFGHERGRALKPRVVNGKRCKVLSIKTGEQEALLYLNPQTGKPLQIELIKYGRLVSTARYSAYATGLPFDPALFKPPAGIQLTDA